MDKKIIDSFDNLGIEQTERLLGENMEMKISNKERRRIENSVYKKTGLAKKKRLYIPKKLAACAAVFAIIFTSLFLVGFDNVAAAVNRLFTFIPGLGITEKSNDIIYTIEPIVGQSKEYDKKANVLRAIYAKDYLTVTLEIDGRAVHYNDISFYINQEQVNYREDPTSVLAIASDSTMLSFSHKADEPTSDDIFEFEITGFPERLSFKMIPCRDYEDIKKIGPTDVQNGISITVTTQKIDNQLVIWCYPFSLTNKTNDFISGYGIPSNAAFNTVKYLQTEKGKIFDTRAGWHIRERMVFDISQSDKAATLHIPYLSMLRNEKRKISINLPKEHTTIQSDAVLGCSLGKIKITEIKRTANEYESDKDTVWIKFAFDSNDEHMILNSFDFEPAGKYFSNARHFDGETGKLEYLEVYVGKNESKISLNITQLYYYLFGEYVIPLDME